MRTRTRNITFDSIPAQSSGPWTATQVNCDGTIDTLAHPSEYYTEMILNRKAELISDQVGGRGAKPVKHKWFTHRVIPYTCKWPSSFAPHGMYDWGSASTLARAYYAVRATEWSTLLDLSTDVEPPFYVLTKPQATDQTIVNDLMNKANQLKVDAVLNAVESNQAWPAMRSILETLPALKRNWRSIRKLLRISSSSYLAWKFGIGPIISDLATISRFAPKMGQAYRDARNTGTRRYSKVLPLNVAFSKGDFTYKADNGIETFRHSYRGEQTGECCVRYVLVVKPKISQYYTGAFAAMDFACSRFSTSPASFAWERIPFSFIADWFVDLRSPLRAIDSFLAEKPYEVVSCTKSIVWRLRSTTHSTVSSPCGGGAVFSADIGVTDYKYYERSLVSPTATWLPEWKPRFGKNQAAITAALIAQRLTKRAR